MSNTFDYMTSNKVRSLKSSDILLDDVANVLKGMAMVKSISIDNLLSFGDITEFQLGKLNILVGPNGSGKSNLIDCIRLLRNSSLDIQSTFLESSISNWIYKGNNKSTSLISIIFEGISQDFFVKHDISLTPSPQFNALLEERVTSFESAENTEYFVGSYRTNASLIHSTTAGRRRSRDLGNNYDSSQSILSQVRDMEQYPEITRLSNFYSSLRIYSDWTFGRRSNLRNPSNIHSSTNSLSESMDNLALVLSQSINSETHERIRGLLYELKESYLDYNSTISFGRVGLEIIESSLNSNVPAQRLSDGTLRFLALAAILLQSSPPPLICLEEPELGMHPDMIRIVGKMIIDASEKTQIIVSTHSDILISSLQYNFDKLFAFDSGSEGTQIRSFSRSEYESWSFSNDLGDLWTSGELGGNRW